MVSQLALQILAAVQQNMISEILYLWSFELMRKIKEFTRYWQVSNLHIVVSAVSERQTPLASSAEWDKSRWSVGLHDSFKLFQEVLQALAVLFTACRLSGTTLTKNCTQF